MDTKRLALLAAACIALSACHEGSGPAVSGYLMAQGFDDPLVRFTSGDYEIDDRACGGHGTLYAFVAKNGAGLACSQNNRIWIVAKNATQQLDSSTPKGVPNT